LPEFVNNCLSKRFLILTLQSFPEFPQESLLAPLRGDIDGPLSSALFLSPDFSNIVVILRHRLLHPSAGSYATAYEFCQYVYILRRDSDHGERRPPAAKHEPPPEKTKLKSSRAVKGRPPTPKKQNHFGTLRFAHPPEEVAIAVGCVD
jgi:hypothetical protein